MIFDFSIGTTVDGYDFFVFATFAALMFNKMFASFDPRAFRNDVTVPISQTRARRRVLSLIDAGLPRRP